MMPVWTRTTPFLALAILVGAVVGLFVGAKPLLLLVLFLGVIGALVGWRWPASMLIGVGSAILLEQTGIIMTVGIPWTVAKVLVAGSIGLWMFKRVMERKRIIRLNALSLSFVLVSLSMVFSLVATVDLNVSVKRMISVLLVFVLVHLVAAIAEETDLNMLMRWLVPAALAYLAYGVVFGEMDEGRLVGTRGNPNLWATSLVFFCLPMLGFLVQRRDFIWRILFGVMYVLLLGNLALSASRSALLVLALSSPIIILPLRKRLRVLLAFVLPVGILSITVLDFSVLLSRFSTMSTAGEYSSLHRAEALVVGWEIFRDNWFIGTGVDTFPMYFASESHSGVLHAAHNMYLTVMVETGLVGSAAGIALLLVIVMTNVYTLRTAWNTPHEGLALGLAAMCGAWMLAGFFGGFYTETIVYFYFGVLLALQGQLRASQEEKAQQDKTVHAETSLAVESL